MKQKNISDVMGEFVPGTRGLEKKQIFVLGVWLGNSSTQFREADVP